MEISYAAIGAAPPGLADKCDHGVAVAGCPLSGGDLLAVRPASIAVAWRRDAPSMRAAIEYAAVLTVAGNALPILSSRSIAREPVDVSNGPP
jgi:hypothetical protein